MPNNLTEQDIQDLNHWLSHFNDIYREMADNDVPVSMSGGEPLTSWETVDKIWFSPKQEYIGQIIDFPDAFSKLQTLEFIRIENIIIPEFPECLTKIKGLKTVIFNNTQMNSVGPSIGNLSNLIKLDLNDNNLVEIPDEICGLISLEEFGVSNNDLESLPDAFSDMKNLARFFAYGNQISTIPESIEFNIQNLISCEFQDNPFETCQNPLILSWEVVLNGECQQVTLANDSKCFKDVNFQNTSRLNKRLFIFQLLLKKSENMV